MVDDEVDAVLAGLVQVVRGGSAQRDFHQSARGVRALVAGEALRRDGQTPASCNRRGEHVRVPVNVSWVGPDTELEWMPSRDRSSTDPQLKKRNMCENTWCASVAAAVADGAEDGKAADFPAGRRRVGQNHHPYHARCGGARALCHTHRPVRCKGALQLAERVSDCTGFSCENV